MTRVLVIDDEPVVRALLQKSLEFAGFEVLTAQDGSRGLATVNDQAPDVVVLDLMMPHIDGFEVLRQLHVDGSAGAPPVIVLTALSDPSVKARCLEAGAAGIMTKPFDPSVLAAEVVRLAGTERQPRSA
jgi:DNA-binding response OmpR family regulator